MFLQNISFFSFQFFSRQRECSFIVSVQSEIEQIQGWVDNAMSPICPTPRAWLFTTSSWVSWAIHWRFWLGSSASCYRQMTWKKSGCSMLAHLFVFPFSGILTPQIQVAWTDVWCFQKGLLRIFIGFSNFSPSEWLSAASDPSKIRNRNLIQYTFNSNIFVAIETKFVFEEQWWQNTENSNFMSK